MMLADRTRREEGFTLVELLIAMTIGGTLIAALGATLILGLGTSEEAGVQVMEASWAQIVGSWFLLDVQGAEAVSPEGATEFTCYEAPDPSDGTLVGSFSWTAPDDWPAPGDPGVEPPVLTHTDWWVFDPDPENGLESLVLMRTTCVTQDEVVIEDPFDEIIAQHTDRTEPPVITCDPDGPACALTWTASLSDAASDRVDRTYEMTVLRRLWP